MKANLLNLASLTAATLMSFSMTAFADNYDHYTGTTSSSRGISSITLTDATGKTGTVTGNASSSRDVYIDQTSTVVGLVAGVPVTTTTVGTGSWMHCYLYIDYDNDGVFTPEFEDESVRKVSATSELVSFNLYGGGSETNWRNSAGEQPNTTGSASPNGPSPEMPTFTIPSTVQPGQYRARFILDWDSIDPYGNQATNQLIQNNGGEIIDFTIQVLKENVTVTIDTPEAGTGTLSVLNGSDAVVSGSSVSVGTTLTIVPSPADGYQIQSVKANDDVISAVDGVYSYTALDDVTFAATFVKPEEFRPTVTITTPDSSQGTLAVYYGSELVKSGDTVPFGTEITISAKANTGYKLSAVKADGSAITATDGDYKYTVNNDVTISADFEAISYSQYSGTTSVTYRGVTSLTISDNEGNTGTVAGGGTTSGRSVYLDQTSTIVSVAANSAISVAVSGTGEWMHSYVYIDYNGDGEFTAAFDSDGHTVVASSELVAYNLYSTDGGTTFTNSLGESTSSGHTMIDGPTVEIPTFMIPAKYEGGTYRMRYKLDWNSIDPAGGSQVSTAGGAIIDFLIKVAGEGDGSGSQGGNSRTVSVATSNATYGSVSIENSTATSISTNQEVTVTASPVGEAQFMYWTDETGKQVSTDATYTYSDLDNITLTAHFGFLVSTEANKGGELIVDDGTLLVDTNDSQVILADKTVWAYATISDPVMYQVSKTYVNDVEVQFEGLDSAEPYYEFKVDKPYKLKVVYTGTSTGVSSIAAEANGAVEYFDLTGVRVNPENLTPGLYIRRSANKAEKVLVK